MKVYESVTQMGEAYVKQLEGLAYTKNHDLALKLVGAIDAVVQVLERSSGSWGTRVEVAVKAVMEERPVVQPMNPIIPTELKSATPGSTPPVGQE